jgi:hypothetical protein
MCGGGAPRIGDLGGVSAFFLLFFFFFLISSVSLLDRRMFWRLVALGLVWDTLGVFFFEATSGVFYL